MYQAMKYLDEIAMKWDTIEEQLENLDLKNVFHIMWVYRNITHIYKHSEEKFNEIINELKTVTINEYYPANVILQFISQLIYRIYSLKDKDEELEFVKKKCEYPEIIEEEDLSELKKYIYSLCTPIVGINTKEVVDIMAYVYEMDGCEEFDGLFEVFEKSNDILIELHLHKVRINRKRNIKNDKKDKPTEDNKNELDFKNVDLEISRDMENLNLKGTVNDIPKSIGDKKPFESLEDFHLDKAKDLLINFKNPTLKFYIENLALFLSLKYDVDIFSKFISFINGGYKSICAKKIFKLTQVPEKNLGLLISGMEGVEKDILRADDLIVFPQTLNLYINWFISSIKGISIALVSEYIDLAKIFILFARKYKHPSLFKIFKTLWDCEIPKIDEEVKLSLIEFFTEIVEIFLSNDLKEDLQEDLQEYWDKIDSLIEEDLQIKDTLQKIITEITSTQVYKKGFVRHLNVLKFFDQDFINTSVSLLLTDFDLDWRYRLNLLEKCYENRDILGLNFREILQLFTKDKVFCVRMKALDIESKINDTIKDQ